MPAGMNEFTGAPISTTWSGDQTCLRAVSCASLIAGVIGSRLRGVERWTSGGIFTPRAPEPLNTSSFCDSSTRWVAAVWIGLPMGNASAYSPA